MKTMLLLLLLIVPREDVKRDRFDTLEVNHYYDSCGRLVFDQLIVWRFCRVREIEVCEAWRLIKTPGMRPEFQWHREEWSSLFTDGDLVREVCAPRFRETWTQVDNELENRELYPKEKRRELSK